jgi:hypothetical protein
MHKLASLRSTRQRLELLLKGAPEEELDQFVQEHLVYFEGGGAAYIVNQLCSERTAVSLKKRLEGLINLRAHQKIARNQQRTLDAVARLVTSAEWRSARVHLDAELVLSKDLRADCRHELVSFDVLGSAPVVVRLQQLGRAERALRFSDLGCFVDAHGLHFRWRGGKGRLRLNLPHVAENALKNSLRVVLVDPQVVHLAS